jgi:hypothetical protein
MMKHDENDTVITEPLDDILAESRLSQSMKELFLSRSRNRDLGKKTKYYLKFKKDDIGQIHTKFKSFYNKKMSQVKGYS